MVEQRLEVQLFLVGAFGGSSVVFLLEAEPGVVEFPRLALESADLEDEDRLVSRVKEQTGMDVAISGLLDPRALGGDADGPAALVLARRLSGSPRLTMEHVGWEWATGVNLLNLPFAPKLMLDELKSFMDV